MPQRMRRGAGWQAEPATQILHQCLRFARAHRFAAPREEQGSGAPRIEGTDLRILVYRLADGGEHGHGALLAPLADDGERFAQRRVAALET